LLPLSSLCSSAPRAGKTSCGGVASNLPWVSTDPTLPHLSASCHRCCGVCVAALLGSALGLMSTLYSILVFVKQQGSYHAADLGAVLDGAAGRCGCRRCVQCVRKRCGCAAEVTTRHPDHEVAAAAAMMNPLAMYRPSTGRPNHQHTPVRAKAPRSMQQPRAMNPLAADQ
jgi:hypothetical protein